VSLFIATGGYIGYVPTAPGTAGSVVGLGLSWLLSRWPPEVQLAALLGLFLLGVAAAGAAESRLGVKDPRAIVIDEVFGMALALVFVPFQLGYAVAAFALFRLLDIVKPMAALERLPGGWGIMCDDAVAALLTNGALHVVRLVLE
jgi:phosphatidylglycerophosphatase A